MIHYEMMVKMPKEPFLLDSYRYPKLIFKC